MGFNPVRFSSCWLLMYELKAQSLKINQNAQRWKSNGAYFGLVRPFKELTSAERRAPERLASRESFRLLGFGGHGGRRFPDSGARARSRGSPRWPSSGPSKRSPPGNRRRPNTPSGPENWSKNRWALRSGRADKASYQVPKMILCNSDLKL